MELKTRNNAYTMNRIAQIRKSSFARKAVAFGAAAGATVASASAQTNEGVEAITTAINGLKPDMGTVVLAAIGLALIGMGAVAALALGKRIMGK
jgi:hypothetical protein